MSALPILSFPLPTFPPSTTLCPALQSPANATRLRTRRGSTDDGRATTAGENTDTRCERALARNTTRVLLEQSGTKLTLYLRRASRLPNPDPLRVKIVEGD